MVISSIDVGPPLYTKFLLIRNGLILGALRIVRGLPIYSRLTAILKSIAMRKFRYRDINLVG